MDLFLSYIRPDCRDGFCSRNISSRSISTRHPVRRSGTTPSVIATVRFVSTGLFWKLFSSRHFHRHPPFSWKIGKYSSYSDCPIYEVADLYHDAIVMTENFILAFSFLQSAKFFASEKAWRLLMNCGYLMR
ncbi:hypothetical protein AVEN_149677-1 [Araneus ventricosus]|uniref:Uncharacterized protein n=1 Tax=Araneus ventricosus TaxID=182803 RepID=A0A4Y2LSX2_ARAVE|nr:hypothetical protein AVEN_149677-1 [Araneus ventricosus]